MLCPSHSTPSTHCTRGWVGIRASMDRWRTDYPTGVWTLKHPVCSELIYILHYSSPCFFFFFGMMYILNTDSTGCVNVNLESFLVCQVQTGQLTQTGEKLWSSGFHSRQEENKWKTHVKCRKTRHNWCKIGDILENCLLDLQSKLGCLLKQLKIPKNCSICIHYKTTVIHKLYDTDHKGRLQLVNLYFHWVHDRPHTHCVAMKPGSTHWVQPLGVTGFPHETMHCHMIVCSVLWKQLEILGSLPLISLLVETIHSH